MNRFLFLTSLSIGYLTRQKRINCFVLLSISIGLLLPCMALANMNVFYAKMDTLRIKNADHTLIANIHVSENHAVPLSKNANITDYAIVGTVEVNAKWGIYDEIIPLCNVSNNILDYENFLLIDGAWPNVEASEERMCVVSDGFIAHYGDIQVGDRVLLNQEEFKVSGIFQSINYYTNILVFDDIKEVSYPGDYTIYVRTESDIQTMNRFLFDNGIQVATIESAHEFIERSLQNGHAEEMSVFYVALISLLFATANISAINKGRFDLHLTRTGTELALGSSLADIFYTNLCASIILLILSIPVIFLLVCVTRLFIPDSIEMLFDAGVYVKTAILGLAMCIAVNVLLIGRIRKLNIVSIIGGDV